MFIITINTYYCTTLYIFVKQQCVSIKRTKEKINYDKNYNSINKSWKTISIFILKVKSVKFLTTDNSLNLRQIYYALENPARLKLIIKQSDKADILLTLQRGFVSLTSSSVPQTYFWGSGTSCSAPEQRAVTQLIHSPLSSF